MFLECKVMVFQMHRIGCVEDPFSQIRSHLMKSYLYANKQKVVFLASYNFAIQVTEWTDIFIVIIR